jgi:hypothetical protein
MDSTATLCYTLSIDLYVTDSLIGGMHGNPFIKAQRPALPHPPGGL